MWDVEQKDSDICLHYLAKHYKIVVISTSKVLANEARNDFPIFYNPRKQAFQRFQWFLAQDEPS